MLGETAGAGTHQSKSKKGERKLPLAIFEQASIIEMICVALRHNTKISEEE